MADDITRQLQKVDGEITSEEADRPEYQRLYQVYKDSRIPVGKATGKMWRMRHTEAKKLLDSNGTKERWDEAVRYYQNDQGGRYGKRAELAQAGTGRSTAPQYSTENIVFANTSALVPALYAKDPDIEFTAEKPENEKRAKMYDALISTLFKRQQAPGLNLKPKARRAVVATTLTNISYLELSYVMKEESSEQALSEIETLSKALSEAKTVKEVEEIEGQLQALEHKVALLEPSGPRLAFRMPNMVIIDPNSEEADLSDADYVMIGKYVRTSFIRAVYGQKNENDEWMSIYKPTHVLDGSTDNQGHDDEINNFRLLDEGQEHEKYGYKSKEQFENACRTLVWYVWDKTTRRVLLFNDGDWSWPIWVWDDPYHLTQFYPLFPLAYYTDPVDRYGRSEVMYYLDQQDEINQINHERSRMRHWAMSKLFYDKNMIKNTSDISQFLDPQTNEFVFGIDLPDGKKISDVMGTVPTPSTQFEALFDTRPLLESVQRLSSVTPIMQNVQFKTNTTNKAIETYESSTQMRLDEKVDAVEDMLGRLGQALTELCIQFMSHKDVADLIGEGPIMEAGGWENMDPRTFMMKYNFRIIGGSTLKPTSRVKKEQAMQLGQILGQFVKTSPIVVLIMLKMVERAFHGDVVVSQQEWDALIKSVEQSMMPQQQPQGPAGGGQQQQPPQGENGGDQINAVMAQIEQIVAQLPPEARAALGEGIAKGMPLKQLVAQLTQQARQP